MQYFDTLPKLIKTDAFGNSIVLTNLMARASVISSLLDNPAVFYTYDIQEGDTPEIIAHKYYSDSYRYWIVLYANQIIDAQWQWPMNNDVFNGYLASKYTEFSVYSTIHHYEKTLTQFDFATNTTTVNTVDIDEDTYNSLLETTKSYTLPTGNVRVTISKRAVSYYDYELELNESHRNIKILKSTYVDELEKELKTLMKQ